MKKAWFHLSLIVSFVGLFALTASAQPADKVVVYYFHSDMRCPTCHKIEQYTKAAVETSFAEEIKTGLVEFAVINTDRDENSHYLKDYQLYTKSVIVSLVKQGKEQKYKNLAKIWNLVGNKEQFSEYIKTEINTYLAEIEQ
ncbi:MAG TPA: nitrophenyl compound nitroreductase subunit ArsF family protein [Thermodesulfobacteriota bacterium]|nr:nitrophenyl compound nitroreductase subunit ArsF family protein [Thermodesulfobacteriota bacterium]HNU72080.1 nitrophenyl compound nitroreductase subunit ArsF family protein [Thermodesulfobacteriota bacterium]HQO77180.1 nitrophenyl compound nitroreductase subunit ArsF family protein [Thermodesulfobacteriota bacterium]